VGNSKEFKPPTYGESRTEETPQECLHRYHDTRAALRHDLLEHKKAEQEMESRRSDSQWWKRKYRHLCYEVARVSAYMAVLESLLEPSGAQPSESRTPPTSPAAGTKTPPEAVTPIVTPSTPLMTPPPERRARLSPVPEHHTHTDLEAAEEEAAEDTVAQAPLQTTVPLESALDQTRTKS
jgi:hypothetical protein